ncbi:PilZ domain-containing protein [Crateriforma conspicua]|nr:PilZ domain-containing protein [Crateriforma conspicua]
MSDEQPPQRKDDRYRWTSSMSLWAELIVGFDDQPKVFDSQIIDVSQSGCAVQADLPPEIRPQVGIIRIFGSQDDVVVEAAGRICWDKHTSLSSRSFGMKFRRELHPELLERLIHEGHISRREHPREVVGIDVTVRRTAGKTLINSAQLIDVSRSGLQIATDEALEIGERILVTLPTGPSAAVKVRWARPSQSGHCAGVAFENLTGSRAINEALKANLATVG